MVWHCDFLWFLGAESVGERSHRGTLPTRGVVGVCVATLATEPLGEPVTIEQLAVNTIKGLAIDGVEKANSGHPGAPMGMADFATVLWTKFLKVDPDDPTWPDRDRFVLSNGHASMLLYSLLHLSGFPITMEDLKQFRQWGSHTAGHPEIDHTRGIETTTGPLGQGFGTAVGMAI